jgi:hypothetical protein
MPKCKDCIVSGTYYTAFEKLKPAFEKLKPDVMQNIVWFVNCKRSLALNVVSISVDAVIKTYLQAQHVPESKIQKFWCWCKLF